jgi:hypothetical protein
LGTGIVILVLIIIVVLTDLFGRLFVDDRFSVSDLMLGTLVGAELAIIGIDAQRNRWWPFDGKNGGVVEGAKEPADDG